MAGKPGRPRKPRQQQEPEDESPFIDIDHEDVETFLYSFAGSASFCRIERVLKNGERGQCETLGFDDIKDDPADYLRKNWGAGRYCLALLGQNKKFVTSKIINVEPRPQMPGAPQLAGGPAGGSVVEIQMQMMRDQAQADRQLLLQLLGNQKGPDLGALLTGIAALTKTGDPAQMFAAMITAFQTVRSANPEVDPMSKARELIGLARELAPGAPAGVVDVEPKGWLDVATRVGVSILDRIAGPGGPGPGFSGNGSHPGQRSAAPAAVAALPPAMERVRTMSDYVASVRAGIEFLRSKAKAGRTVEFWTDFLFEESSDERFNAIIHAVQSGATIENLFEVAPEIAADPVEAEWFRGLYVGIKRTLERLQQPDQGSNGGADLDSAGTSGNGANPADNGLGGNAGQPHAGGPLPG